MGTSAPARRVPGAWRSKRTWFAWLPLALPPWLSCISAFCTPLAACRQGEHREASHAWASRSTVSALRREHAVVRRQSCLQRQRAHLGRLGSAGGAGAEGRDDTLEGRGGRGLLGGAQLRNDRGEVLGRGRGGGLDARAARGGGGGGLQRLHDDLQLLGGAGHCGRGAPVADGLDLGDQAGLALGLELLDEHLAAARHDNHREVGGGEVVERQAVGGEVGDHCGGTQASLVNTPVQL